MSTLVFYSFHAHPVPSLSYFLVFKHSKRMFHNKRKTTERTTGAATLKLCPCSPPSPLFFVLFVVAMFVFVFLHAFATTFQDKDRGKMLVHKIERKKENEKRKLFHTRAWPRVPCLDRVIEISLVYIEPCEHDSVCVCACAYVCAKTELSGDLAHMCICGVLVRVRGVRATRATLCPLPHARWCTYRNTRDFDKERLLYMCIHHIVVYDLFFFSCSSPLWLTNSCACRVCVCLSLDFSSLYLLSIPTAFSNPLFSFLAHLFHVTDVPVAPSVGVWVKCTGLPLHPGNGALCHPTSRLPSPPFLFHIPFFFFFSNE